MKLIFGHGGKDQRNKLVKIYWGFRVISKLAASLVTPFPRQKEGTEN